MDTKVTRVTRDNVIFIHSCKGKLFLSVPFFFHFRLVPIQWQSQLRQWINRFTLWLKASNLFGFSHWTKRIFPISLRWLSSMDLVLGVFLTVSGFVATVIFRISNVLCKPLSGRTSANGMMGCWIDPTWWSHFLFHQVLHNWCNKECGMCYPACWMVLRKEPLAASQQEYPSGSSSGFPLSLFAWSFTM